MQEIVYKSWGTIAKEWAELCERHTVALEESLTSMSAESWNEIEHAQSAYEQIRAEMDHYRATVRIAD